MQRYVCCGCMHVRTGVFFLGLWQMFYHILILTLFPILTRLHRNSESVSLSQSNYLNPMTVLQWEQFSVDFYSPQTFMSAFNFIIGGENQSEPEFIYGNASNVHTLLIQARTKNFQASIQLFFDL